MKWSPGRTLSILSWAMLLLLSLTRPPAAAPGAQPTADLPQILEFHRKLCPVCQEAERIIHAVQEKYPGQFVVRRLYMGEEGYLFRRYQVAIVPTQVFLDAMGKELFRHEGVFRPDPLERKLRELKFIQER